MPAGEGNAPTLPWRRYAPVVLIAALLVFGLYTVPLGLGIPLLDPDEGLHAAIAQEMVEQADWLIPQFRGEPFADKPPLFFWTQALSLSLLGMHDWAVRVPGMIFALLGIATTGLLAWRLFDRETALVASLFQATTILPLALAQAAVHDVALVPMTNLAILCLWGAVESTSVRRYLPQIALAGLVLGLACLTKGLMGLACVGIVIGGHLALSSPRKWWHAGTIVVALTIGCAVAAPWFVLMEQRNPGYIYYYIVQRHFMGYLTETQRHGSAAWWYYMPMLFGGGLPWISYLPALVIDYFSGWRTKARSRQWPVYRMLWVWLIGWTAFVCAAESKLVTYLLPVFPAISILAATAWVRYARGDLCQRAIQFMTRNFRFTTLSTPLVMPIAWLVVCHKFPVEVPWSVLVITCLAGVSPWLLQWRGCSPNLVDTFGRAAVVLVLAFVCVMGAIVPRLAEFRTARELAMRFNQQGLPPQLLLAQDRYGSFVFYLRPELRAQLAAERVGSWPVRHWDEEQPIEAAAILAVPETMADNAEEAYPMQGLEFEQVGEYRLYDARMVKLRVDQRDGDMLR